MKGPFGPWGLGVRALCVCTALLFTGTFARAQTLYTLDWAGQFNDSAGNEPEDNWVANSFRAGSNSNIVSITFPIGATFTNQPISAYIYQGFSLTDPTAGGGIILLGETDTTFSATPGDTVTITLNPPVPVGTGNIFYAAVMIPGVAPNIYPWIEDIGAGQGSGLGDALNTNPLGRSFFDVGPGPFDSVNGAGSFNVNNQNPANITVFGGVHPLMGNAPGDVQSPGNLALWVKGTAP
ncbi:MAG TPA: hypothetical protein VKU02_27340 [Gemmataceae bacterium]|nr:hypothetical protein [Gemmataceae bacterium]